MEDWKSRTDQVSSRDNVSKVTINRDVIAFIHSTEKQKALTYFRFSLLAIFHRYRVDPRVRTKDRLEKPRSKNNDRIGKQLSGNCQLIKTNASFA